MIDGNRGAPESGPGGFGGILKFEPGKHGSIERELEHLPAGQFPTSEFDGRMDAFRVEYFLAEIHVTDGLDENVQSGCVIPRG